jgi:hypothetical protein
MGAAAACSMSLVSCAYAAEILSGPFSPFPGTEAAELYSDNKTAIEALAMRARAGERDDRLEAFETLANVYHRESLNLATELIKDEDPVVASISARRLASTLVMVGSVATFERTYPVNNYERNWFDAAIGSLREAVLQDERPVVRSIAAHTLMRLEDQETIAELEKRAKSGSIPIMEVVEYFVSLPKDVRGVYLKKCLESGSPDVQIAIVSMLAANPRHHEFLRDSVLANPQIEISVRLAAVKGLSRYDASYPSYAFELVSGRTLPEPVSDEVARAYVQHALEFKRKSPRVWVRWKRAADRALVLHPQQQRVRMIHASLMDESS